jgi:membrane protein
MFLLSPRKTASKIHNIVWGTNVANLTKIESFFLQLLRVCILLIRKFRDRQIRLRAMGLVYLTLMSTVPVLAFTFTILKSFGIHNRFRDILMSLVEPLGEQGGEIVDQALGFVGSMQIEGLGLAGIAVLVFATLSALQMIEATLNEIWHVRKARNLLERFQTYFLLITIGPILAFGALAFAASLASNSLVTSVESVPFLGFLAAEAGRWMTFAIAVIGFTFLFFVMPHTRVKLMPALWAGIIAAGAWILIGWAFSALVVSSGRYDAIYSAFASIVLFMFWQFLSWMVVLIGAHGSYLLQHRDYIVDQPLELELSIINQERLALKVLQMVGNRYYTGGDPHTFETLNRELRVPWQALEQTIALLQKGRYLADTQDNTAAFVPGSPFEEVTVDDALAYFRQAGHARAKRRIEADPSVILKETLDPAPKGQGSLTLKDLALEAQPAAPELVLTSASD